MLKKLMYKIPLALIYSRLILGFVVVLLSCFPIPSYRYLIVYIMIWAILSDIFDGIIARRLNISTQKLRRLDSSIDQIFWICTLLGIFLICKDFFKENYSKIIIILALEACTYLISYIKFKKEVATHAISSKFWTLTILAALIQIVLTCQSTLIFNICIFLGIITRLEIIGILLIIKQWTHDVPSIYHAILLRQGKQIKRNKLFNG